MREEAQVPSTGGKWWEEQVFGVSTGEEIFSFPEYRELDDSIQEVMWTPLERVGRDGSKEKYDPMNPNWGKSAQLWFEVSRHLPTRVAKLHSLILSLYIACRSNRGKRFSLDVYHGADAFFFWEGAFVTIDVSLMEKVDPKADFIITPKEMGQERLNKLGIEIATLLKERRRLSRQKGIRKKYP